MTFVSLILIGFISSTFLVWIMWQTNGAAVLEAKRFPPLLKVLFNSIVEIWSIMKIILIFGGLVALLFYTYVKISKYLDVSRDYVKSAAEYCNMRMTCADYIEQLDQCSSNDDPAKCLIGRLGSSQKQKVEFICKPDGTLRVENKYSILSEQDCTVYRNMDKILP